MFTLSVFASLLTLASFAIAQEGAAASSVAQLVGQLRQAPTKVNQFQLLIDEQMIFDFNAAKPGMPGVTTGTAGHTVAADSQNFPAVTGNGVSMTIGYLGPCGMNSPHTHPRATEINFSVNTTLRGGVLVENGARFAEIDIRPGTATIFPMGAIHFEMNPSCEEAMFVAGFNGENPGVQQVAQRFFGLPPDVVGAALGGLGVQEVLNLEAYIPDNVILGVDECLARCGIQRTAQPNAQRQPRVSGNAYPAGIKAENVNKLAGTDSPAASIVYETAAAASAVPTVPTTKAADYVPICDSSLDCDAAASPASAPASAALATTVAASAASTAPAAAAAPAEERRRVVERAPYPEFTQLSLA